jgi:two-component system response regulator FixJ
MTGPTVYIVDGSADFREATRARLSDAGFDIIYVTTEADVAGTVRAMERGALMERSGSTERGAAALENPWPQSPSDKRVEAHTRYRALESRLAPREREVLGYVVIGLYNKNIADRLGISIKTVELYRARGMAKMRARSVAELTRIMITQQA